MKTQAEMTQAQQREHLCLRCIHSAVCPVPKAMPSWYIVISQCIQFDAEPDDNCDGMTDERIR